MSAPSWFSFNRYLVTGLVLAGAAVPAFNVALDPYSTLRTAEWMRQGYNVNERYRKVEHLRTHRGLHDSFIMGSSIMGLYPPAAAQEVDPQGKWYNLAFLAGTPPEALRTLQYLKREGHPIRDVMFGIDMFAFRKLEGVDRAAWKKEHPFVTGQSLLSWQADQVFGATFLDGIEKIGHNLNSRPRLWFDVDGDGTYHLLNWEREIAENHQAFIERQILAKHNNGGAPVKRSKVVMIQERFDELAALKRWLDENGIRAQFWINPMHRKNMATLAEESLQEFRDKVRAAVGDVPDYTLRRDFSDDDTVWYEWKHVRPAANAKIIKEMLALTPPPPGSTMAVAAARGEQPR